MTYGKHNISLQQMNLDRIEAIRKEKQRASYLNFSVDLYLHQIVFLKLLSDS